MTNKQQKRIAVGSTDRPVSDWCDPALASPPKNVGGYFDRDPSKFGSITIGAGNKLKTAHLIIMDNLKWEKCLNRI